MNKKGFTLVELLAVLVILSIIAVILYPIFTNVIRDSKKEINKTNVNEILNAAYNWSLENSTSLPANINENVTIDIETLKKQGYLKKEVIDVNTGDPVDDDCIVRITRVEYDAGSLVEEDAKYYTNFLFKFEC